MITYSLPPEMKIRELRVSSSLDIDELAPASGKRLRLLGFFATQYVDAAAAANTTLRATLAFGTGHTTNPAKIAASYRQGDPYDDAGACMCGINVLGEVDEIIRLTNVTYTGGPVITRSTVFYTEE